MQRHEDIKSFVPRIFYVLTLKIQSQGGGEREAEWEGERLWNESEAKRLA